MTRPRPFPLAALSALLLAAACGPRPPAPVAVTRPQSAEAPMPAVAVDDAAFATSVHRLLRDGARSAARSALMVGAVARQMTHARERFAAHQDARGFASVVGALYLVRAGEARKEMVAGADEALAQAQAFVASRGDEGRTLALLALRAAVLPPEAPARAEVDRHLGNVRTWMTDTRRGGPIAATGAEQRAQAARSLLEPTEEALRWARDATVAWIEQAIAAQHEPRALGGGHARREETAEAFRALRSGGETLVALHLRHGDAAQALLDVERTGARRVVAPALFDRLERAATADDAAAWRDLYEWFAQPTPGRPTPEVDTDPELERAAAWGSIVEAYRRDPTSPPTCLALAGLLEQLELAEVAPIVLADAVSTHPDAQTAGTAHAFVVRAMMRVDELDDVGTARRIFAAAEPLVAAAEQAGQRAALRPGPATLRLVMGLAETRAADLERARTLLEAAAAEEPTLDAVVALASIERQTGKPQAAIDRLTRAVASPAWRGNPVAIGEARLLSSDVHREAGAIDAARADLAAALAAALDAREKAREPIDVARAERLLARVLDRYGDAAGASRAAQRGLVASARYRRQLAAIVLDAGSRALVRRDAATARRMLETGLEADLKDDDLVYAALWLSLAEKEGRAAASGVAERVLAGIRDDGSWTARLAAWGLGRLKDADLQAAAQTVPQKTEALFYGAIARRIGGDAAAAEAMLREVVKSPAFQLIEVQLARDMLDGGGKPYGGPLPVGVKLP